MKLQILNSTPKTESKESAQFLPTGKSMQSETPLLFSLIGSV